MRSWLRDLFWGARIRLVFLLIRMLPLVSPRHDYWGMRTYLGIADSSQIERAKNQLRLAIACIAQFDPRRFARLKADLRGILVHPFSRGVGARYNPSTRLCELSPSAAMAKDFVAIACLIVHEGTHARLRRVRSADADRRVQIERTCLLQEIAFLECVPRTESRIEATRAVMRDLRAEDYTNAAQWSSMLAEWKAATAPSQHPSH